MAMRQGAVMERLLREHSLSQAASFQEPKHHQVHLSSFGLNPIPRQDVDGVGMA